jgi:hypothetical protein
MGEDSRVPPSRRSPEAGRPADAALAAPPAPGELRPEAAAVLTDSASPQVAPPESASPLPRRVRGRNGARPPVHVDRPVLPESFLERFRAAAASSQERDEAEEREPAQRPRAETQVTLATQSESAAAPSSLPRRVRGENGARKPPAQIRSPFLLIDQAAIGASSRDSAETISVKSPPPGTESAHSAPGGGPGCPADQVTKSPRGAVEAEPAAQNDADSEATLLAHPPADGEATSLVAPPADGEATSLVAPSADIEATLLAHPSADSEATLLVPPRADSEATLLVPPRADSEATLLVPPPAEAPVPPPADPGTTDQPVKPGTEKAQAVTGAAKSGAGAERGGRPYRLIGGLVLAAVVAIVGGAFALLHHPAGPRQPTVPSAGIAPVTRNRAAAWVASQVATTDVVACDPVMCRALQARGITSRKLRVLWPGSDNLAGCDVIIATPAVQGQFGARLEADYAPGVIARFGSGDRQIAVRAVAPHGAAAYRADLGKDLAVRRQAGAVLAAQVAAQLPGAAKKELAAGQVDARVMVVIADIEGKHPVRISAFGDPGPGVIMTQAPLRSADLVVTSSASKRAVVAELNHEAAQDPGYRAAHVAVAHLPHGQTVLRVEFAAPSPLGLLGY